MRTKLHLILHLGVAGLLVLAACGKKDDSGAGGGGASSYKCKIFIKKKAAPPIEASASDADKAKATDAAWKAACDKLPAADQADCHNKDKWSAQVSEATMTANGTSSTTITLKLEQQMPELKGKGVATTNKDDACAAALADACKAAGAQGDCVAAGGYEQTGKSVESTVGG
jgi:Na+-transporting NADH:ubiquinone oxidoreductase subunit NqrF